MNKTKFAIGCLVQWYEVDIIEEYVDTLKEAIDHYDGEVWVDMTLCINTKLEKPNKEAELGYEYENGIIQRIERIFNKSFPGRVLNITDKLYTIADYRREFNDGHCEYADVLVWGESDMLVPKQMFEVLDMLHQSTKDDNPKYLATFGTCKMWDKTWEPLEHVDFTNKPFEDVPGSEKNWWMLNYTMTKQEMNEFNNKVDELQVTTVAPHKYNGCGLVISSEVVKSGVNIPRSVFFVHEDTAFMQMTQKVLGNIPQYHFKNILLVHNRKHPKKRAYVAGEEGIEGLQVGQKRRSHDWYVPANKMCEQNCYNIFNPNYTPYTWNDVWKQIENDKN
jgi:hypothetical protein